VCYTSGESRESWIRLKISIVYGGVVDAGRKYRIAVVSADKSLVSGK
jgi:hypothetical protein